jgi:hypothetical protein
MSAVLGLHVKLPDICRCASDVATICAGNETHYAELKCRSCERHRGWLSQFTARWLESVAAKFGAPEIITLRRPRNSVSRDADKSPGNAGT